MHLSNLGAIPIWLGGHGGAPLWLLLLVVPLAGLVGRRVPELRLVMALASWVAIGALLMMVVGERERFDPYLDRIASLLKLDDQAVVGDELRIRMAPDGHFWARARINGVERRMLVDSGATVTGLTSDTAAAANLEVQDGPFPVILETANGRIAAQGARVEELRLGDITARNLAVVVSPAFGTMNVLGMNFLSRLKSWRVEGRTLILVPHHPQNAA